MVRTRKVIIFSLIFMLFFLGGSVGAQDDSNLPQVYLTTDPDNLFDYHRGIYTPGIHFDQWRKENPGLSLIYQNHDANYNMKGQDWEREAHVAFYEPDGTLAFAQNIGIRIHGGWTRTYDRKSLRLYARKEYDEASSIKYDVFPGLTKRDGTPLQEFKRLILRNSGNDNGITLFRDGLLQSLVSHLSFETQGFRPVNLYLNDEYWGIYNLRENYDDFYFNLKYDIPREDVVLLSNTAEIEEGTLADYREFEALRRYVNQNDLSLDKHYQYVESKLDIDNFIQYYMSNIYFVNTDWPGNNISYWRKRTEGFVPDVTYGHDGRWRYALYDTDFGFGLRNGLEDATHKTLDFATQRKVPVWPNPDVSTVMLRNLLKNETFRNRFINTFADNLNTSFKPQRVIAEINKMEELFAPEIERHIKRWGKPASLEEWRSNVELLKEFAEKRHTYMWEHLKEFFALEDTVQVTLNTNSQMGTIKINSMEITKDIPGVDNPNKWTGTYFKGVPIEVTALPKPGYKFVAWVGGQGGSNPTITPELQDDLQLTAVFLRDENDLEVNIPDPGLRAALGEALGQEEKETFYASELASLKELNLRDKGIKNISGLEYAVNLVDLNLRNNKIVDIGPLAKLVKLEKLTIRENKIEDISPLAELTKLKDLSIHSNKVQDITPLENLQELEILTLRGNEISNLSPLKGLRELRDLNIRDNQITSLEALRGLEKLQGKGSRLHLDGNSITDYSPVASYYELIEDVDFVLTQGKEAFDE